MRSSPGLQNVQHPPTRKHLKLPITAGQTRSKDAHCRVLQAVTDSPTIPFQGDIHRSGSQVPLEEFGPHPTVIECAGPIVGEWSGRGHQRREYLWILWSWDWRADEWVEIARAQAVNSEWTDVLAPAAQRCLHPKPELFEVRDRKRNLTDEIVQSIDERLKGEREDLKVEVLTTVYDRIAGRLANCA